MPENPNKFYLTTPIYYVNARPHIGHAYTTIAADVIARRHRLLGPPVGDDGFKPTFFLTGTDEHGQKVQRSAEAAGIPPQQFADEVSASFQNLWKRMGITNDDFLRTTEPRHHRGVQYLWRQLDANGAIYLSSYTGQYCVPDEAFVDVPVGAPCPTCGRPTETITEENYFFRLSDYQLPLIDLIESGTLHIQPDTARNEVLSFLRGGLKDLSISRTTFDWGIPVPGNPKHVVYVWLDALANYITAIGYGAEDRNDLTPEQKQAEKAKFEKYWPADLHLVGKEITRFHCVYWPAILLALNPKLKHGPNDPMPQLTPAEHAEWAKDWLPKSIVANGWLLFEESKMSKSRGNVVRTETILDAFGPLCPSVPIETPRTAHQPKLVSALLKGTASAVPQTAPPEAAALAAEVTSAAPGLSGGSRGLQPPETTSHAGGALAPGLTQPTKAQQDLFAADVLRYFLLREIPFGQDGTFSFDALITRYNADLANGYGNLVKRTFSLVGEVPAPIQRSIGELPDLAQNYLFGPVSGPGKFAFANERDKEHYQLRFSAGSLENGIRGAFEYYDLTRVTENISWAISATDSHLSSNTPWKMPDGAERDDVIYTAAEAIRIITALLYPILPYATASVWRQLGLGDIEEAARNGELKDLKWGDLKPGTKLGPLAPIFPRADKGLAQLMTDMESPTIPAAQTTPAPEPAAAPTPEKSVQSVSSVLSSSPGETSIITIDDFAKVDLRVAQIVVAERIPKADKLLRLEVDLGPSFNPSRRQILAGIAEYYTPESLIGRKVVIVANLAPRKMRGLESQGMVVAASVGPNGAPVLAGFLEDVELGARLK
jgi:methionyl-tRNA synthetase